MGAIYYPSVATMNSQSEDNSDFNFRPVGIVQTEIKDEDIGPTRKTNIKTIKIHPQFESALEGIEEYSNIFVLFWMTKNNENRALAGFPRGNSEYKKIGAFAYRGRNHPNPIGLAVCDLLERKKNILKVLKLDAFDGTVVVDIKPYDDYDIVSNPLTPSWFNKLTTPR